MPRRKVTPEIVGRMEKLKKEGLTYEEIAGKTGLSRSTVAVYMRGEKRKRITPEIIEKMTDLRKQGLTYRKIGEELGIALQTVARHMQAKKLGAGRKR